MCVCVCCLFGTLNGIIRLCNLLSLLKKYLGDMAMEIYVTF